MIAVRYVLGVIEAPEVWLMCAVTLPFIAWLLVDDAAMRIARKVRAWRAARARR